MATSALAVILPNGWNLASVRSISLSVTTTKCHGFWFDAEGAAIPASSRLWISSSLGNFIDKRIQSVEELTPSLRVLIGKILRNIAETTVTNINQFLRGENLENEINAEKS